MTRHPGCVQGGERARCSDHYRHFVIELRERHADVTLSELAEVISTHDRARLERALLRRLWPLE